MMTIEEAKDILIAEQQDAGATILGLACKPTLPLYLDYNWDVYSFGIVLDKDLDIEEIGWKEGDCFMLAKVNGVSKLVKVNPNEVIE